MYQQTLAKIRGFWQKPLPWSELHAIGNSRLAKATILMPLVGYLIIFNDNLIHYFDLADAYVWDVGLLISYKLFLFYFGLTFISIGSIIFHFRCPSIIKVYPDELQYVNLERQNISTVYRNHLSARIQNYFEGMKKSERYSSSYVDKLAKREWELSDPQRGQLAGATEEHTVTLLTLFWIIQNVKHRIARLAAFACYAIGFLLLAIPAIDTFAGVCIAFTARLFA